MPSADHQARLAWLWRPPCKQRTSDFTILPCFSGSRRCFWSCRASFHSGGDAETVNSKEQNTNVVGSLRSYNCNEPCNRYTHHTLSFDTAMCNAVRLKPSFALSTASSFLAVALGRPSIRHLILSTGSQRATAFRNASTASRPYFARVLLCCSDTGASGAASPSLQVANVAKFKQYACGNDVTTIA